MIKSMKTYRLVFREKDKFNFDQLKSGVKSIETRAASVKYKNINIGDGLVFSCGDATFSRNVAKKYWWPSIDMMTKEISFKKVMPEVESVEEMKKVYASYPNYSEKIAEFGLLGFELK